MTPQEAVNIIRSGKLVECTGEEYPEIRKAIHKYAADQVDMKQDIYAQIALMEVKRLDNIHKP